MYNLRQLAKMADRSETTIRKAIKRGLFMADAIHIHTFLFSQETVDAVVSYYRHNGNKGKSK